MVSQQLNGNPISERLVDQVLTAIFSRLPTEAPSLPLTPELSTVRTIHQARTLRQQGQPAQALTALSQASTPAPSDQPTLCWLHQEFLNLARQCHAGEDALVYSPALGRAAVLSPKLGMNLLEVQAALGMHWRPGKLVSRRSLRGVKPLHPRPKANHYRDSQTSKMSPPPAGSVLVQHGNPNQKKEEKHGNLRSAPSYNYTVAFRQPGVVGQPNGHGDLVHVDERPHHALVGKHLGRGGPGRIR